MVITKLLHTKEALAVYKQLRPLFTETDLERYGYSLAMFANEISFFHRVEKSLAEMKDLVTERLTNQGNMASKKNELTRTRKESAEIVMKLAKELKLTPKSYDLTSQGEDEMTTPE